MLPRPHPQTPGTAGRGRLGSGWTPRLGCQLEIHMRAQWGGKNREMYVMGQNKDRETLCSRGLQQKFSKWTPSGSTILFYFHFVTVVKITHYQHIIKAIILRGPNTKLKSDMWAVSIRGKFRKSSKMVQNNFLKNPNNGHEINPQWGSLWSVFDSFTLVPGYKKFENHWFTIICPGAWDKICDKAVIFFMHSCPVDKWVQ